MHGGNLRRPECVRVSVCECVTWTHRIESETPCCDLTPSLGQELSRPSGALLLTGSPADYVLITPAEERMHKVGGKQQADSPGLQAPQAPTLH